jgi:putative transposase
VLAQASGPTDERAEPAGSAPPALEADLIGRHFQPAELDVCRAGDITSGWTGEGWRYLASVIDLGSRRVVGWAMADHLRAELVWDALRMAINQRRRSAA